jgi:hypothetical protein
LYSKSFNLKSPEIFSSSYPKTVFPLYATTAPSALPAQTVRRVYELDVFIDFQRVRGLAQAHFGLYASAADEANALTLVQASW